MKTSLDSLLQGLTQAALSEGERYLKVRALKAGIEVVRGLRRLLLVQYLLNTACFLFAVGLLVSLWFLLEPLSQGGRIELRFPLLFGLGLSATSGGLLYFSVREKTWLQALQLERSLDALTSPAAPASPASVGLSREELAQVISELLDQKLAAKPTAHTEPASESRVVAVK